MDPAFAISPMARPETTARIARGVARGLAALGYAVVSEYPLPNGRRADIAALDGGGRIAIVEIKSGIDDFRADRKWHHYREFCDFFYFAVAAGFPLDLLSDGCGILIADAYEAEIRRAAPEHALNGNRRRAQILRLALTAAQRLQRLTDPPLG